MKKILMKDASGKVRLKSADRRSAYEAAGWIAVEENTPKKETKTVVVDEPVTLKMADTKSDETQENNEE